MSVAYAVLMQTRRLWFMGLLPGSVFATSCASEQSTQTEATSEALVTYSGEVRQLLDEHCIGCHREGGIAPFSLTDFESAQTHAADIAEATRTRTMPPMPVSNDGECNTFSNARWLEQEQIDTLQAWAEQGAPKGTDSPTTRKNRDKTDTADEELDWKPDATLDIGVEYTPRGHADNENDDYHCFVVDSPTDQAAFLSQYQVLPGDARVVHHLAVFQPAGEDDVDQAKELDEAQDGPGYTCFGDSLVDASLLAVWSPGTTLTELPAGTGLPIAPGRDLIVQVHYNLENGVHSDRTKVALGFSDEPVRIARYLGAADADFQLPPHREKVESSSTANFDDPIQLTVYGVFPHMHYQGRTMRVEAQAMGESRCLMNVDRWDFHWQNAWWYDEPLELDDVRSLSIKCGFNTEDRNNTITWGDASSDEMCIGLFYATTNASPDDEGEDEGDDNEDDEGEDDEGDEDDAPPEVSCDNTDNPLFGSCFDDLLDGCYEPDREGECTDEDLVLTWSDEHRMVAFGDDAGLYSPGEEAPCALIEYPDSGEVSLIKGEETLSIVPDDGPVIRCPNGDEIPYSEDAFYEYQVCRGLKCPE